MGHNRPPNIRHMQRWIALLTSLDKQNSEELLEKLDEINGISALEAGSVGFMARSFIMATMPHSRQVGNSFIRTNGDFTLTMVGMSRYGLPYGVMPRLILAWVTTEAFRTKDRELVLGNSMSEFMRELGIVPTGGKWGSIGILKRQSISLFASAIHFGWYEKPTVVDPQKSALNFLVSDKYKLWWEPQNLEKVRESRVTLSQPFFDEITKSPVPIDMRVLRAIKKSPMALDIYMWATWRVYSLKDFQLIKWPSLQAQFGSGYPATPQGVRDFKKKFKAQLDKIVFAYPQLNVDHNKTGLILKPSDTHIPKKLKHD